MENGHATRADAPLPGSDGDARQPIDLVLRLRRDWLRTRHVALLLCRVQQRLESRMKVNPQIPGLTQSGHLGAPDDARLALRAAYSVACEAEVMATTDVLMLQEALPLIEAKSLAGVVAKLEMVMGADRDIDDPTDFPWPQIASALRDLKAIAGDLPTHRMDRISTRAEVARHWNSAVELTTAIVKEDWRP